MVRILGFCLVVVLFSVPWATAQEVKKDPPTKSNKETDAKELSGMSILGNEETPKALYIVPWKSSEIGSETNMDMMLNESDVPVDREVFKRQVDFYHVSTQK